MWGTLVFCRELRATSKKFPKIKLLKIKDCNRFSVVSFQWSVFSDQFSEVSFQLFDEIGVLASSFEPRVLMSTVIVCCNPFLSFTTGFSLWYWELPTSGFSPKYCTYFGQLGFVLSKLSWFLKVQNVLCFSSIPFMINQCALLLIQKSASILRMASMIAPSVPHSPKAKGSTSNFSIAKFRNGFKIEAYCLQWICGITPWMQLYDQRFVFFGSGFIIV